MTSDPKPILSCPEPEARVVTISIVSHNHGLLVKHLMAQLCRYQDHIARIIVTFNIREDVEINQDGYPFEVCCLYNDKPLGFGSNHNQAFQYCQTEYFCVLNPDISVTNEPFLTLLQHMRRQNLAIIAPQISDMDGQVEDNARYFPTLWGIAKKVFGHYHGKYPVCDSENLTFPDWVAGMFMLIRSNGYAKLSGFNESYFLYYEDVDLCARAWDNDMAVAFCQQVNVVHDARRASHRNFKFFILHLKSAARYFVSHIGRRPHP